MMMMLIMKETKINERLKNMLETLTKDKTKNKIKIKIIIAITVKTIKIIKSSGEKNTKKH